MFCSILTLCVVAYFIVDWVLHMFKVGQQRHRHVFITGCDSGFGRDLAV
ncbi:unnamed protein product [Lymnaea stagnalis]|uniref:Uncharacterized protein n=1 Tax=Lymnaea stagnalis TaxID=6523 RepID=A0AAV2IML6_LYMST